MIRDASGVALRFGHTKSSQSRSSGNQMLSRKRPIQMSVSSLTVIWWVLLGGAVVLGVTSLRYALPSPPFLIKHLSNSHSHLIELEVPCDLGLSCLTDRALSDIDRLPKLSLRASIACSVACMLQAWSELGDFRWCYRPVPQAALRQWSDFICPVYCG